MAPAGGKKRLRSGFTTGTAAAAATKGALTLLLTGQAPTHVTIPFLTEGEIRVPLHSLDCPQETMAVCTVIKDAGDDPDITHRAEIGAEVRLEDQGGGGDPGAIHIDGGQGVGRVTLPGLEVPPGEAAINPGPRRMIRAAVDAVRRASGRVVPVTVRVFVPRGVELATRTLNARLGILGGISILGTTGIERPLSHEAYEATIDASLSVAVAAGIERVVFCTGRRSERFAQALFPELEEAAFVQIGDFFKASLEMAAARGLTEVVIAVFFGKAVKMAQEIPHTHAARSELVLRKLAGWTEAVSGDPELAALVAAANTARHSFDILTEQNQSEVLAHVGERVRHAAQAFAGPAVAVRMVLLDYAGGVVCTSPS